VTERLRYEAARKVEILAQESFASGLAICRGKKIKEREKERHKEGEEPVL
jgi:hypothetical protein